MGKLDGIQKSLVASWSSAIFEHHSRIQCGWSWCHSGCFQRMTLFGIGVDDVKLVLEKERILKLQISPVWSGFTAVGWDQEEVENKKKNWAFKIF